MDYAIFLYTLLIVNAAVMGQITVTVTTTLSSPSNTGCGINGFLNVRLQTTRDVDILADRRFVRTFE